MVYYFTLAEDRHARIHAYGYDTVMSLRTLCEDPGTELFCTDDIVSGQSVIDVHAVFPGLRQTGAAQNQKMMGRVRQTMTDQRGQGLDAAFALAQVLHQFQAYGMADCLGDLGQLCKQLRLGAFCGHLALQPTQTQIRI